MQTELLIENLRNPAILFFALGLLAVYLKSDLRIPPNSSKFISLYLLFSIGFTGGKELSHEPFTGEIMSIIVFGIVLSVAIPIYSFYILRRKLSVYDAGAVAAAYGSVSVVTYITAISYLEFQGMSSGGHMVAIMALMESPAIITGLFLVSLYNPDPSVQIKKSTAIRHSLTNGSVLLILGSLIIGYVATTKQAEGIKPFTTDIFKGFLAVFLLDMGITSGKNLKSLIAGGIFPILFAVVMPLVNGTLVAMASVMVTDDISSRFLLAILAASASYIAVPAAMRMALPQANTGIFVPMALGITFPVNIVLGMPLFFYIVTVL